MKQPLPEQFPIKGQLSVIYTDQFYYLQTKNKIQPKKAVWGKEVV